MSGTRKIVQLYRNSELIGPSSNNSALENAKLTVENLTPADGEIVLIRYKEDDSDIVKSLVAVYHAEIDNEDSGWTFLTLDDYYNKEEIDETERVIAAALTQLDGDITTLSEVVENNTQGLSDLSDRINAITESDPVFTESPAAAITSSDITNWNGKTSNVGTVTGIIMNGVSKGTSGVVDLGTVLTSHQDISGKADKSDAIGSLSLALDSTNYKITLSGTKVDGTTFTVSNVIDLPLESVVVNGSYNNATKKVVLTLQNGSTVEFSVADLVAGLQSEITSTNKLSADLISDGTTNKVVTESDVTNWNSKTDNIGTITGITMNGSSKGTSGVVNLGTVITAHQDISGKADKATTYTKTEVDTALSGKQATLVSGTNIKTINGNTLLGEGDMTIDEVLFGKLENGEFYTGLWIMNRWSWSNTASRKDSVTLYVDVLAHQIYRWQDTFVPVLNLATVATSGSYNDLTDKPTIPSLNNYYTKSETDNLVNIPIIDVTQTGSVSQTLAPNTFYRFSTVSALTLALTAGTGLSIYSGKFTASADNITITFPSTIKFPKDTVSIVSGCTYEFNIADGICILKDITVEN